MWRVKGTKLKCVSSAWESRRSKQSKIKCVWRNTHAETVKSEVVEWKVDCVLTSDWMDRNAWPKNQWKMSVADSQFRTLDVWMIHDRNNNLCQSYCFCKKSHKSVSLHTMRSLLTCLHVTTPCYCVSQETPHVVNVVQPQLWDHDKNVLTVWSIVNASSPRNDEHEATLFTVTQQPCCKRFATVVL